MQGCEKAAGKVQDKKKCNKVVEDQDYILACERTIQESDNSIKEDLLASGRTYFHIFCSTGEERREDDRVGWSLKMLAAFPGQWELWMVCRVRVVCVMDWVVSQLCTYLPLPNWDIFQYD